MIIMFYLFNEILLLKLELVNVQTAPLFLHDVLYCAAWFIHSFFNNNVRSLCIVLLNIINFNKF